MTDLKIIAVGNSFYGDDGIGVAVLNSLKEIPSLEGVSLIDGATDALGLIDHFNDTEHVILIDAAFMGFLPGTVKVFKQEDAHLVIKQDHLSLHGISIADTLELAKRIDALPKSLTIIGVEPEQLEINTGLSETVSNTIPDIVSKILTLNNNLVLN